MKRATLLCASALVFSTMAAPASADSYWEEAAPYEVKAEIVVCRKNPDRMAVRVYNWTHLNRYWRVRGSFQYGRYERVHGWANSPTYISPNTSATWYVRANGDFGPKAMGCKVSNFNGGFNGSILRRETS
jgi:hypothetical protein